LMVRALVLGCYIRTEILFSEVAHKALRFVQLQMRCFSIWQV